MSVFGVIPVRVYPHSDWIRKYLSVFCPNVEIYGPEQLRLRILFMQWKCLKSKLLLLLLLNYFQENCSLHSFYKVFFLWGCFYYLYTMLHWELLACLGWCSHLLLKGMLGKLQKRVCTTVSPSLAPSLEPLGHRQNVASLSLFYRYYFGKCSFELAEPASPPYSCGRFNLYCNRLHDFSVNILRSYKDVYCISFFPCLWNGFLWSMIQMALNRELISFSLAFRYAFHFLSSSFSCSSTKVIFLEFLNSFMMEVPII